MRIIVEEYPYSATEEVKRTLKGLVEDIENVEGRFRVNYVGYYYNPTLKDTVFCLPKVVLKDSANDKQEKVFDLYEPEKLLEKDYWDKVVKQEHKDFLFDLSVWIYRAINVFQHAYPQNDIVRRHLTQIAGKGKKRIPDTFLEILLALIKFNQDNRDFLLFTIKNIHSGYNKINWTRTISHSAAFVQENSPLYLNPVNKKRQINFDEELLVIYYSILNHMRTKYGFVIHQDYNFQLLSEGKFEQYLNGLGKKRLREIRYKYFSDKAIELWELCAAFFEIREIAISADTKQYLLVKNFNIVFEAMIDELIGTPMDELPPKLMEQKDGKIVDHLYKDTALSALMQASDKQKQVYYIGDSKYYKMHRSVGEESEYKQYTYAKNIIHYNLELLTKGVGKEGVDYLPYRDPITEGYEVTPNFFISADLDDDLNYDEKVQPRGEVRETCQFKNRLFDRDTLLLSHYDVNFLHILSLYARDKMYEKAEWKKRVREIFKARIKSVLESKYEFMAITPREGVNSEAFFRQNFQQLLGKVYTLPSPSAQDYYLVGLNNKTEFSDENDMIRALLEPYFYINETDYSLGDNPAEGLPIVEKVVHAVVPDSLMTVHHIQRYKETYFLIGCYKSEEHWEWINGKNDKGTLIYNVRVKTRKGPNRPGAIAPSELAGKKAQFVILFKDGEDYKNEYHVFYVNHNAKMDEQRMKEALYPNPSGNYYCYVFDEEVKLSSRINIAKILFDARTNPHLNYEDGSPILMKGEDLLNYIV